MTFGLHLWIATITIIVLIMFFDIGFLHKLTRRLRIYSYTQNVLSRETIKKLMKTGKIVITNVEDGDIQPASIDIRVANDFLKLSNRTAVIDGETVDIEQHIYLGKGRPVHYESYTCSDNDWFEIKPKEFVLASAKNYVKIPDNIIGLIEGKYTIGRQGLLIQNAGIIDPGYTGKITLQMYNITKSSIFIQPGQAVGQIVLMYTDKETTIKKKVNQEIGEDTNE